MGKYTKKNTKKQESKFFSKRYCKWLDTERPNLQKLVGDAEAVKDKLGYDSMSLDEFVEMKPDLQQDQSEATAFLSAWSEVEAALEARDAQIADNKLLEGVEKDPSDFSIRKVVKRIKQINKLGDVVAANRLEKELKAVAKPHGVKAGTIQSMIAESSYVKTVGPTFEGDVGKTQLMLPGKGATIIEASKIAATALDATEQYFVRNTSLVCLQKSLGNLENSATEEYYLNPVSPAAFGSVIEEVCSIHQIDKSGVVAAVCLESTARQMMAARPFIDTMPPISLLCSAPVIIKRDEGAHIIRDYDRRSGILVSGEGRLDDTMTLNDACKLLNQLLTDFQFATPADKSRAMATIITPALTQGMLFPGRSPLFVIEADASQTGKGYFAKLVASVYNVTPGIITQVKGGVGSPDESYATHLMKGSSFILFDNIRGKFDSPKLESALTEDVVDCRSPYSQGGSVDPRRVTHMMTSNKAELTRDLANRSCFIGLKKRFVDHPFQRFDEGYLLQHVRANQGRFLGAIFVVIKDWIRKGCSETSETSHDFRQWCGALDWIVINYFDLPPIMEGHTDRKQRTTDKNLNLVRDITIALAKAKPDEWLRTHEILDFIEDNDEIEIPCCKDRGRMEEGHIRRSALQGIGRCLGKAFDSHGKDEGSGKQVIRVDGYQLCRQKVAIKYPSSTGTHEAWEYLALPFSE